MGAVPTTCVLGIALVGPTPDETEAFHLGRSRNYMAKVTRYEKASWVPRAQSHVGPFDVFSFFIATWMNYTRVVSLFSMTDATTIS
jgi:hypothetical protein